MSFKTKKYCKKIGLHACQKAVLVGIKIMDVFPIWS